MPLKSSIMLQKSSILRFSLPHPSAGRGEHPRLPPEILLIQEEDAKLGKLFTLYPSDDQDRIAGSTLGSEEPGQMDLKIWRVYRWIWIGVSFFSYGKFETNS